MDRVKAERPRGNDVFLDITAALAVSKKMGEDPGVDLSDALLAICRARSLRPIQNRMRRRPIRTRCRSPEHISTRHWRHGGSGIERGPLLPSFKSRQSGSRSKLATAKENVSPHIPLDFPWRVFDPHPRVLSIPTTCGIGSPRVIGPARSPAAETRLKPRRRCWRSRARRCSEAARRRVGRLHRTHLSGNARTPPASALGGTRSSNPNGVDALRYCRARFG